MQTMPYAIKDEERLPQEVPLEEWFFPPVLLEILPPGLIEDQA